MRAWSCPLLLAVAIAVCAAEPPAVKEPAIKPADREHWSFKPVSRPDLPKVGDPDWIKTPVDTFIRAALDNAGLKPAPAADKPTWLRRVTYDLTGLPPTPKELDAFLADDDKPDAHAKVIDRLLASPHYGERWTHHWLDVVRYAESNGFELDAERPHAWRYRDWVVRALNADKPYDQFLTEQLAGDLLAKKRMGDKPGPPDTEAADLLVAAGFNRCGPAHLVSGNTDPDVNRQEILTEMTSAAGSSFLGITMGCARCHDHKFDPVSQADYYRLQAFFAAALPQDVELAAAPEKADFQKRMKEWEETVAPVKKQIQEIDAPYRKRLTEEKTAKLEPAYREALATPADKRTAEQKKLAANAQILIKVSWDEVLEALSDADRVSRQTLRNKLHAAEATKPAPLPFAYTVAETGRRATHVLKRGDPKIKLAKVEAAYPRVLLPDPKGARDEAEPKLSRLDLAKWLTSPDNPLTARVIVNRLWQYHFGRGLVSTPNDFGRNGAKPTHPELLDWLASELVANKWSLKHIHRQIVLSSTYRQESRVRNEAAQKADPDNKLLWRMNRQRMTAEGLRDAVLTTAGTLNPKLGGPMIRVPLEPEVYDLIFTEGEPDGLWHVTPDPKEHTRRSLYLFVKRNVRLPMLEAFDQPDTLTPCPVRPVSTFAPQALILMNGPFLQEQSKAFATRLWKYAGSGEERVKQAYRLALARTPRDEELKLATAFLADQADHLRERLLARLPVSLPAEVPPGADPAAVAALADFCLALLNRNEFLYVF